MSDAAHKAAHDHRDLGPQGRGGGSSPPILCPLQSGGAGEVAVTTPGARWTVGGGVILLIAAEGVLRAAGVRMQGEEPVCRRPCSPGAGGGVGEKPPFVALASHVSRGISG